MAVGPVDESATEGVLGGGSGARPRPRPGARPTDADADAVSDVEDGSRPSLADRAALRAEQPAEREGGGRPSAPLPVLRRQPQQLAHRTGGAVVSAARVGRLLGRTGWRLARQLPGVSTVEAQVQRAGSNLVHEFARLLEMSQNGTRPGGVFEEERAMMLLQHAADDPEPLRSAMTELLDRSGRQNHTTSDDYLYGSIISQLVPDEARVLSALVGGREFAALDVVVKPTRGNSRVELANVSTLGRAAKVAQPANTATYIGRLHALGLLEFDKPSDDLASQFDALREDPAVRRAKAQADGKVRLHRKRITLSPFGQQFWDACAPRISDGRGRR